MAGHKAKLGPGECDSGTAAQLLMCSRQWFLKLVKDGWITALATNRYRVVDVVQGHIKFMKDEARRTSKSATGSRVQEARAAQIELQTAKDQRQLIEIEEVQAFLSETVGALRSELSGVPAASSRDPIVRAAIEKNLNAAVERCRAAFAKASDAVAERKPIPMDAEETDA